MNKQINPKYLNDDSLEIRVFSEDPIEQKRLDNKNKKVLERGIKTIEKKSK